MEKNRLNIYLSDEDYKNLDALSKRISLSKGSLAVFLIKLGIVSLNRGLDNNFDKDFQLAVVSEETGKILSVST